MGRSFKIAVVFLFTFSLFSFTGVVRAQGLDISPRVVVNESKEAGELEEDAEKKETVAVPSSIYEDVATQILFEEELAKIPEEERTEEVVSQIITKVGRLVYNISDTGELTLEDGVFVGFTGFEGNIVGEIPKGKYNVSVNPVAGVNIIVKEEVVVGIAGTYKIDIGLIDGDGEIETVKEKKGFFKRLFGGLVNPVIAQELKDEVEATGEPEVNAIKRENAQVVIQLFHDKNRNGTQDLGEANVPWAGVKVTLASQSTVATYKLHEGWNFISFPFFTESITTARELVEDVALSGGYVTTVSVWDGDRWDEYSQRGGEPYGHDFPLEPGKAYFVRNHEPTTWTVSGSPLPYKFTIPISRGWNAVGIPQADLTAESALDSLQFTAFGDAPVATEAANQLAKWNFGLWEVLVKRIFSPEDKQIFGFDFPIEAYEGYFIFAKQDLFWDP